MKRLRRNLLSIILSAALALASGPAAASDDGLDLLVIEGAMLITLPVWGPFALLAKGIHEVTAPDPTQGMSPEMAAVYKGPDAIADYARGGGKFTDAIDKNGLTSAMMAVRRGPETIKAFAQNWGKFTDIQDRNGQTAAMMAAAGGAETIRAFAENGGKFNDMQDKSGWTACMRAAFRGTKALEAYADAGGDFTDQKTLGGVGADQYMSGGSEEKRVYDALVSQHGLRHVTP